MADLAGVGFKLDKFSASYWRGDQARGINMQRLYALVYDTQDELDSFIKNREEAKKRDHRVLGEQLDLFTFSELVGKGLPLFTPNGTWLRENLNRLSQDLRIKIGFQRVNVPHIAKQSLYEKSGHWAKFGDEWLTVTSQESSDKLVMKPMNCPHHQQIYASKPRSYKDLPIKYLETTTVYRDEKAGEMLGLSRVRSITQDDSHIFCREDQIETVYSELVSIVKYFYAELDIRLKVRLSFRDPNNLDKYLGDSDTWDKAEGILRELAIKYDLDYFEGPGEAAFYGPKLDFMGIDALGREWQLATPQLDFIQPKRFELDYVDENGDKKIPVMIHFALMGSLERFLSVYIEHTAGKFPLWLAPEQIRILTINDQVLGYVDQIKSVLDEVVLMKPLKYNEIRYTVDERSESLGKKIREAKLDKIPMIFVIGQQDVDANQVSIEYNGESTKVGLGELKVWLEEAK
jgi:threonyl-tRNA synthetase